MIAPIILTEEKFTQELDSHLLKTGYVALNLIKSDLKNESGEIIPDEQIDFEMRELKADDVYKVGVLCKVVKKLKLPDGSVNILVHGIKRYRVSKFNKLSENLIQAKIDVFDDILEEDEELDAYTRSIINQVKKLSEINPYFNEEMKLAMLNSPSPGALADLVAFALSLDIPEAQDFLETLVVKKRFGKLLVYLRREKEVSDIQKKISDEVSNKVNKYQREYFLREQLKVIRTELGMDEDDKSREINKIKEKLDKIKLPEVVLKVVKEEVERLEVISENSPEYNVSRTYLNWVIELPWNKSTEENIKISKSKKILEEDHYGLEKAKQRVLEFLAVRRLKPDYDGTIICLIGPPGVGKTSFGKSIARALGREFYRFSLGGMRDEAEIKGHRRTYVGAMPGKIIHALKRVSVNNPVIMLDEIDKLGSSYLGDPASTLLEVLDPEQNNNFIDHYLDVPFDLSKVLFIATANYIGEIPSPLLDRMEIIDISGYSIEEKVLIGQKWVIPKLLKKHALSKKDLKISVRTLKKVITDYAREPGIRVMEQSIAKVCRATAFKKVSSKKFKGFVLDDKNMESVLGTSLYKTEVVKKKNQPGIATGLAWTGYGGDILFIETIPLKGKGEFKLTGQLGDVMNESATIAYSYVRKQLEKKIKKQKIKKDKKDKKEDFLSNHEVHLHVPAGATPKDGPSAGVTMALALYSLATGLKIKDSTGMTGELSLTGKVLPVGGIKEKVLAAKRSGLKYIILPSENKKDLKDIPSTHRKGLKFYPVEHFDEVLKIALKKGE